MKIIATYFLKALYQLQAEHFNMYMFSYDDIFNKINAIAPDQSHSLTATELKNLFDHSVNPVELKFCTKIILNDVVYFMPNFEVGTNSAENAIDNSFLQEDAKSKFDQYYPEAYDDYVSARSLFLTRDVASVREPSFVEKTAEENFVQTLPATDITPQFQLKTFTGNGHVLLEAQEINPIQEKLTEETSTNIRLDEVLKAICEIVLFNKNNVYDYSHLLTNILAQQRFTEEQRLQVLNIIIYCNKQLLQLGYCYEYTGDGLHTDKNIIPAKFAIRVDKKFVVENFSQNVDVLQQLHSLTIQELQNSFNMVPLLSETTNKGLPQLEFYDYQSVQQKVDNFLKLSHQQTNTLVLTILATLMMKEPRVRFASKDVLSAIDNSFEFVKTLPVFKPLYLSTMQKLLSCPYILLKRNMETNFFIPNMKKKFCEDDFSETNSQQLYNQVMQVYKAQVDKTSQLKNAIHASLSYGLREARLFLTKEEVREIFINYGILDAQGSSSSQLEELLTNLCFEGVFSVKNSRYAFQFNAKASTFIANISQGLLDLYHQLKTRYSDMLKRAQLWKQQNQVETFPVAIQQFASPIVQPTNNKRLLEVVNLEEDGQSQKKSKTR